MLSIGYYCVVSVTIGDQSVRTLIKTLIISKYFVGSGANPVHTHVVVKSLVHQVGKGQHAFEHCYHYYGSVVQGLAGERDHYD